MSIKVMTYVWDHSTHTGSDLLMLLALADHANDDGVAWPSLPRLAARCRVTKRQAIKIIQKLEKAGSIRIEHGRGRGHVSVYTVQGDPKDPTQRKGEPECTFCGRKGEPQDTIHVSKGEPQDTIHHEEKVNHRTSFTEEKVNSRVRKGELQFTRTIREPSEDLKPKDPPIVPPGGPVDVPHGKVATQGRRKKTSYPTDPDAQETLRALVFDAAFDAWVQAHAITLDLSDQWERFGRKALANGYTYLDWRLAFMNWLTSPYQTKPPPGGQTSKTMDPKTFAAEAAKWKGRL